MLHIILFILTIIGWILLAILGIIVLFICVILFTPMRYRGDANCKGTVDSLNGRLQFSWLAHLVSGHAVYEGGKLNWAVRIAWKKMSGDTNAPPPEKTAETAETEKTEKTAETAETADFPYEDDPAAKARTEGKKAEKLSAGGDDPKEAMLEKMLAVEPDSALDNELADDQLIEQFMWELQNDDSKKRTDLTPEEAKLWAELHAETADKAEKPIAEKAEQRKGQAAEITGQRIEQAEEKAGPGTEQAEEKAGPGTEQADEKAGPGEKQAEEKAGLGTEQAEEKAGPSTEQAEEKAGPGTEQTDEKAGPGTEQADEKAGPGEKQAGDTKQKKEKKEQAALETAQRTGRFTKVKEKISGLLRLVQRIRERLTKIYGKMETFYEKLKYTFRRICDNIKTLLEKKDKLKEFITDKAHRRALFAVLAEIRRLLRFLKPRKLHADIRFGFENPAVTGNVLAAVSMAYPFIGAYADIHPDFQQRILEGNFMIAGRVRMVYAAIIFWNLVWNKNVRTTFRHIRKFKL